MSEDLVVPWLLRTAGRVDRLIEDITDIEIRLTAVEKAVVGVNRRRDRCEARFDRVERRLDLVDMPH